MSRTVLAAAVLAALVSMSAEKAPNAGIVYGQDHSFIISAPKGWVLDNQSGQSDGLQAVFYREGQTWSGASAVLYANVALKSDEATSTLEKTIEKNPTLSVKDGPRLKTQEGRIPVVKDFGGDRFGNFERIAYLDESKVVVFLVLSARTKKEFEASLKAFAELVATYNFLGDQVKLPPGP
jgi:hypothetical protein